MFRLNIFFHDQYPEIEYSENYKTKEEAENAARTIINFDEGMGYEIQEVK